MPGPKPTPVPSDPDLPPRADVVVIGAGIVGTSAALELAERGFSVALCEKGDVGAEQSSRNWGWVRLSHRDPREMPLMVESVRLWKGMNARVGDETGYRQCGITFACASEDDLDDMEEWAGYQRDYQIPVRMVRRAEALRDFPGLDVDMAGAMVNPADGRAEPQLAAPAVARALQALGGTVHQNCAVRVVETASGRISGVVTEKGRIACDAVLLAGGVWTRPFLRNLGIYLPQLNTNSTVLRTSPIEGGPEGTFKFRDFTFRRRLDGGYTIAGVQARRHEITPDSLRLMRPFLPVLRSEWRGMNLRLGATFWNELRRKRRWGSDEITPFEVTRILDPTPDADRIDALLDNLKAAYPAFRNVRIEQRWGGVIDVTPDVVPVISGTEGVRGGIPGLFVASGFSGHGFGLGPGAGRLASDLITGSQPVVDPAAFRLARFTDGSNIAPIVGVTRR